MGMFYYVIYLINLEIFPKLISVMKFIILFAESNVWYGVRVKEIFYEKNASLIFLNICIFLNIYSIYVI